MALSREDRSDVARSFGRKAAGAVSKATRDASPKSRALDSKTGDKKVHKFRKVPGTSMKTLTGDKVSADTARAISRMKR